MYGSGRKGDACPVGFSPTSSNLALFGLTITPNAGQLLETLGKHKRGAACLYVNRLEDIDLEVLAQLAREGHR